jgi:hypothetical protein
LYNVLVKKTKLPTEKTLKTKLWNLVKEEVRKKYPWDKCYICKKPIEKKKKSHTGHLFKIGSLPLQLKYDPRLLRPCCVTCNLFLDGNEARYMVEVLREVGLEKLMEIVHDIENTTDLEGVPVRREFLLNEISKYVDKDVT